MYDKNLPDNVYHLGTVIDAIMIGLKNMQKKRSNSGWRNSTILMDNTKLLAIKPTVPPKDSWMMPSMGSSEE
jgi:hypothetical protein